MFRFFRLLKKSRSVPISLPSVMSFGEFYNAFDVLREDAYALGEMAGIVACQAVPSLEIWILENWSKGDVPVPPRFSGFMMKPLGISISDRSPSSSNKGGNIAEPRSIERGSRFLLI